jgi:hypothetical protein
MDAGAAIVSIARGFAYTPLKERRFLTDGLDIPRIDEAVNLQIGERKPGSTSSAPIRAPCNEVHRRRARGAMPPCPELVGLPRAGSVA